ncbi:hypothetical protein [Duganella sp. S19_KUP01_CR8]|uniref:hypothetical protein n=1 Tax=Duganella sp. S19_KUP01_CR8 TaxID=3025502 RepID=UPI002FCDD660
MAWAVSAVMGAVLAPTVASVLGAIAAVGALTTVVGVVTGKQNLVKIGGELGLVGGLGGLAAGALSGAAAAGLGEAGVAEGASAGAFSDVAGEQFALSQGMDAAGSGFGAANAAGTAGATGIINSAQAATSAAPAMTGVDSLAPLASGAQPPPIDSSLASVGSPGLQLPTPDASAPGVSGNAAATAPQSLSDSTLSDAYSDVAGEKYAASQGMDAAGSGFGLSPLESFKKTIGDGWSKLSPQTQAEVAKSLLAIPGGIQNQKNINAQMDLAKQRLAQTSHGSEVPSFGIIAKAMKGNG